jgi:hypothetical protein
VSLVTDAGGGKVLLQDGRTVRIELLEGGARRLEVSVEVDA